MGRHLEKDLFFDYLSIGFAFSEGSYTAVGDNGLTAYDAQTA